MNLFHKLNQARINKKKALNKKNRKHQHLFQLMRLRMADEARIRSLADTMKPRRKQETKASKEWTDKVSKVRNRLTGKKRESKERWNRFAGTSDAGSRGL